MERIYLYGSQSRGDWNDESDIDILVVFAPEKVEKSQWHLTEELVEYLILFSHETLCFLPIMPQCIYSKNEVLSFEDYPNNLFMKNVSKYCILIYKK